MGKDNIEFECKDVTVPLTKEEYKERLLQLKIEHDEDGDEVYPRMVSPNFDTYEEAAQFANDNGLSYDTGLPSEKLKSAYDKANKEFHDFRTSYYVTHPYDKESNYEYDNQKGWHLKDNK